ncbi:MAG TPA: RsmB/NOP family class I SAM-dependent RNA methyltransferase [Thermohalobaculum sp.]|nr:RsmB/NOP family class I SAM-dependent RNA methyltransferase [Thermohalobaculum sp.]
MTPAARIQAAIDIVDRWRSAAQGLDQIVASWGRENRYAGSGDRRAIADLVYDAVRRLRSAAWVAGAEDTDHAPAAGRAVLLGSLVLDGLDRTALAALFSGEGYAPAPLAAAETARLGRPLDAAPRPVRLDFPNWLAPHLAPLPDDALAPMRERAAVFLRVNLLRADREAAIAALAGEGIGAEPGPLAPACLRVLSGARHVAQSRALREGLVEVQDAASQAAADYARARPGETVLDYCAGAGGKTLALAAAMRGAGRMHAHDIAPQRLEHLVERARRAGVEVRLHGADELQPLAGRCDLVFVDAPCSGSGTWRRQPDAKWRLSPQTLAAHTQSQDAILAAAAAAVRPGGRLVYATCSMLALENEHRMRRFLAAHPAFRPGRQPLRLTPIDGGDGFFACELVRKPG